ncbi:MAG: DUF975 family protein [Bacteroidota bacterium]
MKTKNAELMHMALATLKGKWGLAVGTYLLYYLIISAIQTPGQYFPAAGIASLILSGPFALGLAYFTLTFSRGKEAKLSMIFLGFNRFGISLGAYLLMVVFTLLWSLLLIIPGIIAAISYSMTFFILADDGTIGAMAAIDKSKQMMYGYKWKYFCLGLRFIGWGLLSILTLGVGLLWLIPYVHVSLAKFYDDIKDATVN